MWKYELVTIRGTKPTKKDPKIPKVTAKEALEKYLNETRNDIVSVMPMGFGGYQLVIRWED